MRILKHIAMIIGEILFVPVMLALLPLFFVIGIIVPFLPRWTGKVQRGPSTYIGGDF